MGLIRDESGTFDLLEATEMMEEINYPNAAAAAQELVRNCDRNGNNAVTFYEFTRTAMIHLGTLRLEEAQQQKRTVGNWEIAAHESIVPVNEVSTETAATICR